MLPDFSFFLISQKEVKGNVHVFTRILHKQEKRKHFSYPFLYLTLTGLTSGHNYLSFSFFLHLFSYIITYHI